MADSQWQSIEQPAGAPFMKPVEPQLVENKRRRVYEYYERFLRRHLEAENELRPGRWDRDYSSLGAYEESVSLLRNRMKDMFGFWVEPEERPPLHCYNNEILLENDDFVASRLELEVLPGVATYAVELRPTDSSHRSGLLLQHGYGGTPELICGLTQNANREDYSYRSLGLRAVRRGYHVVAVLHPYGYGTLDDEWFGLPEFPHMPGEYAKNRLHRLALLAGKTSFGLDLMASSRGIDLLQSQSDVAADRIGVYGLSQGGQTAMYLAAIDTRIRASVVSAYFNRRIEKLIGHCDGLSYLDSKEEDKFFPEVVSVYSDADVASLIAPRAFAVEAGLQDASVDFEKARAEFELARQHFDRLGIDDRIEFLAHEHGHVSATEGAFDFLAKQLIHKG